MAVHLDRLHAALADRYALEHEIGAGGMATVHLAHDLKHDRQVAVKVLRPELAAALGSERFLREIQVTANLQHPHILPLYDSGEADGLLYYVMPYVEGESLRECLNRDTQLAIDDAVRITEHVASALDFAHRHDVIHRDIKPENILLHEGEAVVADFGIALAVSAAGGERLTETGLSLGTPAYMSPEQICGGREIDGRSDTYSLACVLYEMLAGAPPFTASSPRGVLARHVTDPVPPITTVRSSVPRPVVVALTKALAKAPADRFESAHAFADSLTAEPTEAEAETKSIVVLPFENLSPDPDQEYFSDGLTEEVIAHLSKVKALRVISRSSAMTFKGTDKRIPEIAEVLNVRYALEGSVRRAGNNLRITAQLIDAEKDAHLWADNYTGTLDDVFDIQESASRAIVDALRLTLTPEERGRIAERRIDNIQAYECYLRARLEIYQGTAESLTRALRLLENGLEITGPNALLYSEMVLTHYLFSALLLEPGQTHLRLGEESARKALLLDPESAEAHYGSGMVAYKRGDVQQAVRELKKALAVNSSHPETLWWLSWLYFIAGKTSAAEPLARKLVAVDPLTLMSHWMLGFVSFWEGRFEDALASARTMYEMDASDLQSRWAMFYFHAWARRFEEAHRVVDLLVRDTPEDRITAYALFLKHAFMGEKEAALEVVTPELVELTKGDEHAPTWMASGFAAIGETETAIDWLEHANSKGFFNYPFLAEYDPFLTSVRGEPRFKRLMEKVKRQWEQFEV